MIVQKNTNQHMIFLKNILECLFNVQEICWKNRLACLQIVDTGGAFLPLQSDIFLRGGRGFANQALMSSQGIQQVNQTLPLQIVEFSSLLTVLRIRIRWIRKILASWIWIRIRIRKNMWIHGSGSTGQNIN